MTARGAGREQPVIRLPRVVRGSAAAEASRLIREMILSGALRPGDRLPAERELSEALGVSRPTIRESIRSLVAMNILESRHGSGTYVASLDTEELLEPLQFVIALAGRALDELFEARLLLEPSLAALAAERATEEEIAALRACAREGAEHRDDHERLLALDLRLHRRIADAARNRLLLTFFNSLTGLGVESRAVTVELPGVAEHTGEDHARIVDAIAAHDPEAARCAMREHLERVAQAVWHATSGRRRSPADPHVGRAPGDGAGPRTAGASARRA